MDVGIIGAGSIAQIMHLSYLAEISVGLDRLLQRLRQEHAVRGLRQGGNRGD